MLAKYRVQVGLMLSIEAEVGDFTEDQITRKLDISHILYQLRDKGFKIESSGHTVMDTGVRIKEPTNETPE